MAVAAGANTPGIDFSQPAASGSLSGQVTWEDETPAPLATVAVLDFDSFHYLFSLNADEQGNYTLPLRPGRYLIIANAGDSLNHFYRSADPSNADYRRADVVEVAAGAGLSGVDFSLKRAAGSIGGNLALEDGTPVFWKTSLTIAYDPANDALFTQISGPTFSRSYLWGEYAVPGRPGNTGYGWGMAASPPPSRRSGTTTGPTTARPIPRATTSSRGSLPGSRRSGPHPGGSTFIDSPAGTTATPLTLPRPGRWR